MSCWCLARGVIVLSAIGRVFWLKNTKVDSHQFMDLNTHQNTKMQTLTLSNIDYKT
ncbi:pyrazinamidase/nicotinamidase [Helicobacter pylori]|nr:pyrazinamidase/nicotinamidase [Helicobacter pylori]